MSRLDELIKELCPNGVEYKKLELICSTITTGKLNANAMEENGIYPFFTCDSTPFKINTYAFDEEAILISGNGSQVGHINYYKGKFNAYQRTYVIYGFKEVNVRFLLHYLNGYLKEYILRYCKKGSVPYITLPMLQHFSVPVPPLEVQCEIVHILDDFTLLSAELSAELKARQKQYEYYRSSLFEKYFNNMIELEQIGDVTKLAGFEFTKYVKYTNNGNIIALRGLNVKDGRLILNDVKYIDTSDFTKLDRSKLYNNDILYTYVGTVGQVGLVDEDNKYYLAPNVARIRISSKSVLPKYVMYFLQTPEFKKKQLDKLSGSSSMKNITMTNIRKFKIPIPPIEIQEKIVNILDRFDKLCNDISEGLPAEIEARQKQYEYYRDKLLTFKELKKE